MLFTSAKFVLFLAITLVLYYAIPKKAQWELLLVASYVFYYIADPRYLIFIAVTTVTVWAAALILDKKNAMQKAYLAEHKASMSLEEKKAYKETVKKKKWAILLVFLIANLAILSVTKYTNFVISNINGFLSEGSKLKTVDMIVPMGISFYTFQSLGYLIDVYRGTQSAQKNVFKFALFVSFFPQLVQGPISRYGALEKTLFTPHKMERDNITLGLTRILWGYFKKLVVADRLIAAVKTLTGTPEQYTGVYVFCAMLFYAFELYCDFTGGIDITIGIAKMMGIDVAENFDLPFFSKNIKEYWNRWHITMGTWFTDYIFYPVSVCSPMLKLSKWSRKHLGNAVGKRVSVYLSSLIVWFTTGLWHGAAWNFIVWGLMNFVIIMISQELEPLYKRFHDKFHLKGKAPYEVFQMIRTMLLMSMVRMFDVYRDVPLTFKMVGTMFTKFNFGAFADGSLLKIGLSASDYILLLCALTLVLVTSIIKYRTGKTVREHLYEKSSALPIYAACAVLLVLILVFGAYGVGYDSSQFIYNQF